MKTKKFAIPGFAKATTTSYNKENYIKKGVMAGVVYGKGNYAIKQTKTSVTELPKRTIIKTTKYGPVNYFGKQTKKVSKQVIRK